MTYEKAMKRLEEIVKKIESGEMDIDSLAASLKEAKASAGYKLLEKLWAIPCPGRAFAEKTLRRIMNR